MLYIFFRVQFYAHYTVSIVDSFSPHPNAPIFHSLFSQFNSSSVCLFAWKHNNLFSENDFIVYEHTFSITIRLLRCPWSSFVRIYWSQAFSNNLKNSQLVSNRILGIFQLFFPRKSSCKLASFKKFWLLTFVNFRGISRNS